MVDPDRIQINEARIRAEFDELAQIDSESFGEREMADRLKESSQSWESRQRKMTQPRK